MGADVLRTEWWGKPVLKFYSRGFRKNVIRDAFTVGLSAILIDILQSEAKMTQNVLTKVEEVSASVWACESFVLT
jgi:hypothetical protein